MMMASTASRSSTMISRPSELPMVLVSEVWVVLSAPLRIAGVAVRIPFITGSITTIRIATTMNAMIAAMIICANALELQSLNI